MWDLPRPGLEPVSPALAGRFSTTAPPGKPLVGISDAHSYLVILLLWASSKKVTILNYFMIRRDHITSNGLLVGGLHIPGLKLLTPAWGHSSPCFLCCTDPGCPCFRCSHYGILAPLSVWIIVLRQGDLKP